MNPSSQTPEKPRIRPHRCSHCLLGYVIPTSRDGRFFTYKDVIVNLPLSVYIPECGECNKLFPTAASDQETLDALVVEYKRDEDVITKALERLRRRKGIN